MSSSNKEFAPFYIGQEVVAVDAMQGSKIKNGNKYIVNSCDYAYCKGNYFWYVGVIGHHNRLRPTIFSPIPEAFESITLTEVLELETPLISVN